MKPWTVIQGNHFKRIAGHSAVYFVASVLTKAIGAVLLPIYTHWLAPEQYAVFSNLLAISGLAGVFISLYMDNAYSRLFFDTDNDPQRIRQTFSTIALFMLAWGVLTAAVFAFGIRHVVQDGYGLAAWPYAVIVSAIPLLRQFRTLGLAHYRTLHISMRVATTSIVFCLINGGAAVLLLIVTTLKGGALLWATLLAEGATTALVTYWLVRDGLLAWRFSPPILREAIVYALGLLPLTATSWVSGYSDRLLITWFGQLSESGVYSVAFELGNLVNLAVMAIFMAYGPMVMAMLQADPERSVPRLEAFQSFYMHLLVGAALFMSVFAPEGYHFLVNPRYHAGIPLVPIIAFGFVFNGARKLHATLIYYHKKTLLISVGGLLQAIVNFGFNIALIPALGGYAAAWSRLAAGLVVAVYFHLATRRYQPLRIDWRAFRDTVLIYGTCATLVLLAMFVLRLGFWPLAAAKVGVVALAVVWSWRSRHGQALRRTLGLGKQDNGPTTPPPAGHNNTPGEV